MFYKMLSSSILDTENESRIREIYNTLSKRMVVKTGFRSTDCLKFCLSFFSPIIF